VAQDRVVCIVDDDEAVRDSLQILLETMGYPVQSFESGPEFLEACVALDAGCVLLDIRMPKMSGMEVQKRLNDIRPDYPVIIVTGHGDVTLAVQAMRAGAADFIEKPFQEDALLASVEHALSLAEQAHLQGEVVAAVKQNIERLTPREREVFDQLIIGHANKVIARALECSPRTVEIHRARVMEKMEATSVAQLVRMALVVGIEIAAN
jgi:two-component system response regulator FixJ